MNYFDHKVRVRYAETDQMGMSHHSNYWVWFEEARSELFRELGLPYSEFEKENIFLPVGESFCQFKKPAKYDELITIRTSVSQLKLSTIKFTYQVLDESESELLAWGYTTHIFVDQNQKLVPIPESIKENVTLHELPKKINS